MRRGLYFQGDLRGLNYVIYCNKDFDATWFSERGRYNWSEFQGKWEENMGRARKDTLELPEEFLL